MLTPASFLEFHISETYKHVFIMFLNMSFQSKCLSLLFLFAGCCTAWAENRSLALKHAFFFLPVPIKLWALSVIATLKLLRVILQVIMQKTWQASKTDNKQTKTKQTQPKTEKQKPPHGSSQVFLEVKKGETLRFTPLNPHMCSV